MGPKCLRDDEGKRQQKLYCTKYDALSKFDLTVGPDILEVLVAEDDDLALRDEQREFVAALCAQLRELHAGDLCA